MVNFDTLDKNISDEAKVLILIQRIKQIQLVIGKLCLDQLENGITITPGVKDALDEIVRFCEI